MRILGIDPGYAILGYGVIDTAGVSTESARKAAPPSMAGMTSHAPYLRINEYRAKMILQKRTSKHPNSHHT